jgi:hypothetical protein
VPDHRPLAAIGLVALSATLADVNAPLGRNTTGCPSRALAAFLGKRAPCIDDRTGGDLQPLGFEMPLHLGVLISHPTQRDLTPP